MPDPPIMPRTACVMDAPSSVGSAIQHADEALTTGNRLSGRPLLTDITGRGVEVSSGDGPNREYKRSQLLAHLETNRTVCRFPPTPQPLITRPRPTRFPC